MSPDQHPDTEEALSRISLARRDKAISLVLSDIYFPESLVVEIAALSSLQSLDISYTQIADIRPLAALTSLQSLNLSGTQIADLSPLAKLTSLQSLNVSSCNQIADLSPLAELTSLQSLDLSWTQIADLSPIAALTSLQSLDLSHTQIADFSPLAELTSLRSLYLAETQVADLSPIAALTSLQSLDISRTQIVDIRPIEALTSLQSLELFKTEIADIRPIAALTSLQSLTLYSRQIADIRPIEALTRLRSLNLFGRQIDDIRPIAALTSLQSLDLSGTQIADIRPITALTSLQSLSLTGTQIADIRPITALTSLQSLDLSDTQIVDLSPLVSLTDLRRLDLQGCTSLRQFSRLRTSLLRLRQLSLLGCHFEDLPLEVCGHQRNENCLPLVRAYYADLDAGQVKDTEVKVLLLGNGSAGKTQLSRRLRDLDFDPAIPTTHAIQLESTDFELSTFGTQIRLNIWDFGGQEVYHGTHALFIQGRVVFLLLWTPELERASSYVENGLEMSHRPLPYWLDYLRAFAGTDSPVILIQSRCDEAKQRVTNPPNGSVSDFAFIQSEHVSAKTGLGLDRLGSALDKALCHSLNHRPPLPIGVGRARVRDRLRSMLSDNPGQYRTLDRVLFHQICIEIGGISDEDALLDFLHHSGVVFYRQGVFSDQIILDQNWALQAIYTLFDRSKVLPLLRGFGRFTRADLEQLVWSSYTREDQEVFLGMMQSCGICFRARRLRDNDWEYIAPELLPEWSEARQRILAAPLEAVPPNAEVEARYELLHEGILRNYLSKIGQHAGDTPIYWRYGFSFYEETTASTVLVQAGWDDASRQSGAGNVRFRAWGTGAASLLEPLLNELEHLPFGQKPEVIWKTGSPLKDSINRIATLPDDKGPSLANLSIAPMGSAPNSKPEVYISYSWGDDKSEAGRRRAEIADGICACATAEGWIVRRDKDEVPPGGSISEFTKKIVHGGVVILVLSERYLERSRCMAELNGIFLDARSDDEQFCNRIIAVLLDDAKINDIPGRARVAKYWKSQFEAIEPDLHVLGAKDLQEYHSMKGWHWRIGDILHYITDKVVPMGYENIVRDNYASLREMLAARRPHSFRHTPY